MERACSAGARDVMFKGGPVFIVLSSGTSGKPKLVPYGKSMVDTFREFQRVGLSYVCHPSTGAHVSSHRLAFGSNPEFYRHHGIPVGSISGLSAVVMPKTIQRFTFPEAKVLADTDWASKAESIVKASRGRRVRYCSGVPSYLIRIFQQIVTQYKLKSIRDIWPELSLVVYSGSSVDLHRERFRSLVGPQLHFLGLYVATEAPMGLTAPDGDVYRFHVDGVLLSFNDVDNRDDRLRIDELKPGHRYFVNVGTSNGLLQYAMRDVVEICQPAPSFRVVGRSACALSLACEKLSDMDLARAVECFKQETRLPVEHFMVYPNHRTKDAPVYEFVLFCDSTLMKKQPLAQCMDECLKRVSENYKRKRNEEGLIGEPLVQVMNAGLIRKYFDCRSVRSQFKMKTVFASAEEFQTFSQTELTQGLAKELHPMPIQDTAC